MFFSNSARRFTRRGVFALFVMFCLSATFLLTGCGNGTTNSNNVDVSINGTWNDAYNSNVTINIAAKTIVYKDNYEGTIENSPDFKAANGVLIIKFTKYWDADYTHYPNVTYTETTANNGKFGAMYWTGLTDKSVSLADAYLETAPYTYEHTMFNTFADAQTAFTPAADKVSIYVDWSNTSPYTRQ
jgi:hypothetical protein